MNTNQVALVTGANKGIGFEIAKDLVKHGFTVLIGSRTIENGETAAKSIGPEAYAVQLDVTNQDSISSAVTYIETQFGRLDVLINNAAISHPGTSSDDFASAMSHNNLTKASLEDIRTVWETNVFGVIAVTQAMLPLLHEAPVGRIVNMGSTGASMNWNSDPDNSHRSMFGNYSTSKTALHAISLAFAFDLEDSNIKVNIACPGHSATALNNFSGARTPEMGAKEAVRLALIGEYGPTATFSDDAGTVAW